QSRLALQAPLGLELRWEGYSSGALVGMYVMWVFGLVLPLTLILPAAFSAGNRDAQTTGAAIFAGVGFLLLNFVGLSQTRMAPRAFDRAEQERLREVDEILDRWNSLIVGTYEKERLLEILTHIYERHFDEVKLAALQRVHLFTLCGWKMGGRFLCWTSEAVMAGFFVVMVLVPLCVMVPLGYSDADLSYTFGEPEIRAFLWLLALAPPLCFALVVLVRLLQRARRATRKMTFKGTVETSKQAILANRSGNRHGSRSGSGFSSMVMRGVNGADGGNPTNAQHADPAAAQYYDLDQLLTSVVRCVPSWVHRVILQLWAFVVQPLVFFLSLLNKYETEGFPSNVRSSESVKNSLRVAGFSLPAIFLASFLLARSLMPRSLLQFSKAEMRAHVEDQVLYLRICKASGIPIQLLGDYPYFSIGEGIVTKGLTYLNSAAWSVGLYRMYGNMVIFTAGPSCFALAVLPDSVSAVAALVLVMVLGPLVCFGFYAIRALLGVTPTRWVHAIPWFLVWTSTCLVLPIVVGIVLLLHDETSHELGLLFVIFPPLVFLCYFLAWLRIEFAGLNEWRKRVTIQTQWLTEVSGSGWKISYLAVIVIDTVLLGIGFAASSIPNGTLPALLILFTLMSNTFLISFYLLSVVAGVVRVDMGISRATPFVSMAIKWVIFMYSWAELYNIDDVPFAGVSSLLTQSVAISSITVGGIFVSSFLTFVHSVRLWEVYQLKKLRYHYFPETWELAEPTPRGVCEQACKVIDYPTDAIVADLRKRKIIEPDVRELLRSYIDPKCSRSERLSIKNRLFVMLSKPFPSREELEHMLEQAIERDASLVNSFNEESFRKSQDLLSIYDNKDHTFMLKFEAYRAEEIARVIQEDTESVSAAGEQEERARDEAGETAGQPDNGGGTREMDNFHLPTYFAENPDISAFNVAKVDALLRLPSVLGHNTKPSYERINHLIVIDAKHSRLIMINYRVWEPVMLPLAWLKSASWVPEFVNHKLSLQVKLTIERPAQVSCGIRKRPSTSVHLLYFETADERQVFCTELYRVVCVSAPRSLPLEMFKSLLRFRTVSAEGPVTGTYAACCDWLERECQRLIPICSTQQVEAVAGKPVLVVTVPGRQPELDRVVLNAHYDVVPAMEEFWDVDPWAAEERDGRIYGRGTQDMKCVAAQYVLALARLCATKAQQLPAGDKLEFLFERTLFVTFVPDEEIGGRDGMGALINQGHFDRLFGKVGVALDEGLAHPGDDGQYTVFYGERMPLWVLVHAEGPTGHGSRFIKDTAIEKLVTLANKAFAKRKEQEKILGYGGAGGAEGAATEGEDASGCKHCEAKKLGDVLTINLTVLKAGVSTDGGESFSLNVIPTSAMAGFDIRVPVTTPIPEVMAMLDEWCQDEGMRWEFDPKVGHTDDQNWHAVSSIDRTENKWWGAFEDVCKGADIKLIPEIFPAGTDSRFLRMKHIPAFGFSPMTRTPVLLHEHNEYIDKSVFLEGIKLYETIPVASRVSHLAVPSAASSTKPPRGRLAGAEAKDTRWSNPKLTACLALPVPTYVQLAAQLPVAAALDEDALVDAQRHQDGAGDGELAGAVAGAAAEEQYANVIQEVVSDDEEDFAERGRVTDLAAVRGASHPAFGASAERLREEEREEEAKMLDAYRATHGSGLKSTKIGDRESEYQKRRFDRGVNVGAEDGSFKERMTRNMVDNEREKLEQDQQEKDRESAAMPPPAMPPPASGSRKRRRRWDAGPEMSATEVDASSDADALAAKPAARRRRRWDQGPTADPKTVAAEVAASLAAPAATTNGDDAVSVAASTMTAVSRIERDIALRNRPLSDAELDKLLPSEGFKIIPPPANYKPLRRKQQMVLAAPDQDGSGASVGYSMGNASDTHGMLEALGGPVGEEGEGMIAPDGTSLPAMKQEDMQFFGKLMEKPAEGHKLSSEETKERKIMHMLLRIKNGTPMQRKAALRQITVNARELGAGPLFNQILPLLMSPTLEEQERHLLVKTVDRILFRLDDLVRPYVHKILVVIEPMLIDEDHIARAEGRELIANLAKAAGLWTMIATMRPDIDHTDEYVRNTTARAFAVVASALGIQTMMPFLKAVCQSRKAWQARHTGIKIVQQISILMGCAVLPHLTNLVSTIEHGLRDDQQKVRAMTARALAALAESAYPYGIESFDTVLEPLWEGIRRHNGKALGAYLQAIGYIIPLMDDEEYASYFTKEVMTILQREFESPDEEMRRIVLKVCTQCVSTEFVRAEYIRSDVMPPFFKSFWVRRMALDRRNCKALVEATLEIAKRVGGAEVLDRLADDLKDENEPYRRLVMQAVTEVLETLGANDVNLGLEQRLVDGALLAFQEQGAAAVAAAAAAFAANDTANRSRRFEQESAVMINGFATILNALGEKSKPYIPQICGTIKFRLHNKDAQVRMQAADLVARIAGVMKLCDEEQLMGHLGVVLYEYLGEEYPEVLGSILGALTAIVNVIGMNKMTPPIKDLLPRCTPILKNRAEKVQENCINLVGRIADRGAEFVAAREWMRICFEMIEMLRAKRKSIRRAAVSTFGFIAKAIGPQDVIHTLLNNLKVQDRMMRVCTTVAIAIVAESCGPFAVLPALMNEYRVTDINVQNGVLKSMSFLFEYIGDMSRDYIYSVVTLLEDALMDKDQIHRQTACRVVQHLALGVQGVGCDDALGHLLNYVWPNVFETNPHVIGAVFGAIEALRVSYGAQRILQHCIQGLFHPARRVREVYWKIYNNLYVYAVHSTIPAYPRLEDDYVVVGDREETTEMDVVAALPRGVKDIGRKKELVMETLALPADKRSVRNSYQRTYLALFV
ncbi:Splicing factor 3B subunit 1 (Pre-mRNA-splicing factor SF3b 155 kDa subunit) (SF3b155) (Spliceosome-associated protein 155) (SAP 155), partial [Durusdinium trenchii]